MGRLGTKLEKDFLKSSVVENVLPMKIVRNVLELWKACFALRGCMNDMFKRKKEFDDGVMNKRLSSFPQNISRKPPQSSQLSSSLDLFPS